MLVEVGKFIFIFIVVNGVVIIKIISRINITSINGVTLILCISSLSSRFSLRCIVIGYYFARNFCAIRIGCVAALVFRFRLRFCSNNICVVILFSIVLKSLIWRVNTL